MVAARKRLKVFVVKENPAPDTANRYLLSGDQILDSSQAHSQNAGTFPLAKEKLEGS